MLHLPKDFERWPEFIEVVNSAGASAAAYLLLRLWVELGYEVETTSRVGFLRSVSEERFRRSVHEVERALEHLRPLMEPESGGWMVPRFARHHEHLDPSHVPMHMRGAAVSKWARGNVKADQQITQQSLLIPPEIWKKPDGSQMNHEEIRRVMVLISALDRALGRPERPATSNGFTEGLVLDAWRVMQTYLPDQVDLLCRRLILKRGNPVIPNTTEQVLPRFRNLFEALV